MITLWKIFKGKCVGIGTDTQNHQFIIILNVFSERYSYDRR